MRRINGIGKMVLISISAFLQAGYIEAAWAADKPLSDLQKKASPTTVEGQVSITLGNRETLKFGLVEVMLVHSNSATEALAQRAKTGSTINTLIEETSKYRLLERGLEALYPKVAAQKAEGQALLKECESLQNEIRTRLKNQVYKGAEKKEWEEQLAKLIPECESSRKALINRDAEMKKIVKISLELIQSRAAAEEQILSLAAHKTFFTESKLEVAQRTTTDTDGNFKILVPTNQPYYLFAYVERNLPDGDEQYGWAVSLTNFNSGRIILNNQNALPEPAAEHSAFVTKLKATLKKAKRP